MNKIGLIIRREYLTRVRNKTFIIMTFLGPLLIAGLMTLAIWLGMSDTTDYDVLVVDNTETLEEGKPETSMFWGKFEDTDQVDFEYTRQNLTNQEFEESDYTLMITLNEDVVTYPEAELVFRELPSLQIRSYIKSQVEKVIESEKLKLNEISPEKYASIRTDLELVTIDSEKGTESFKQEQAVVGFLFAVIIYFFIFLYGVQVMRGVMEEKTSRIVEVMISSVKPFQLMMGKIIGIALVGLTQFMLWVVLVATFLTLAQGALFPEMSDSKAMMDQMQVSEELAQSGELDKEEMAAVGEIGELIFFRINWPLMIGVFVFYFLGGYLLYASLFAAVGSAVDSEADTQQFMLPISIPLVFGFIVAEFALQNPEGAAVMWGSQIPLTSPVVMMVRVAMGFDAGDIWQLFLSMALLVLGFVFTVWLASRIYRIGILLYGKKVTYKDLGRWLFSSN